MVDTNSGCLYVVGTGIGLAGQITTEARNLIKNGDRVYAVMAEPFMLSWLRDLNPATVSLQDHYGVGKQRDRTYEEMVETILSGVRAGERVCAAFYGHPGVFVWPSHEAVRRARAEGFEANMYPGISAEDCLFADVGFDPAHSGCQSYEAQDFMLYERHIDPTAALILWQMAALGDTSRSTFETDSRWVQALADVLQDHYPADHEVIIYEASAFPLDEARIEPIPLIRLAEASYTQASTLYVPPVRAPGLSRERLSMLGVTEEQVAKANFQRNR